jgi:hypothetical protein
MKIKALALLICASFNFSAMAEPVAEYEQAWKGNAYISVIVKLKPNTNLSTKSTHASGIE